MPDRRISPVVMNDAFSYSANLYYVKYILICDIQNYCIIHNGSSAIYAAVIPVARVATTA